MTTFAMGVLQGEGVGHELTSAALTVLHEAARNSSIRFDVRFAPEAPLLRRSDAERTLMTEMADFFRDTFARRGAMLCGPKGGRFVYELRRQLDLFYKLSPLVPLPELGDAGVVRPEARKDVDIMMVRDNAGGLYQGQWQGDSHGASHSFSYTCVQVERVLGVAMDQALKRRGHVTLVVKRAGVPSISRLWIECCHELSKRSGVICNVLEVDTAVYYLVQHAPRLDVVVSPNMFGDVLADCGGLLLGSRGLCYSANFGDEHRAVYQTGHGAAHDIAGRNIANPSAQILSLIMMLRHSYDQHSLADTILMALRTALAQGWRTADVAGPGQRPLGTREFVQRVIENLHTHRSGRYPTKELRA